MNREHQLTLQHRAISIINDIVTQLPPELVAESCALLRGHLDVREQQALGTWGHTQHVDYGEFPDELKHAIAQSVTENNALLEDGSDLL